MKYRTVNRIVTNATGHGDKELLEHANAYGYLLPGGGSAEIVRRLLARREIDPATGCWNWTAGLTSRGYGKIKFGGKTYAVHRLAAILWCGLDPESRLQACHSCDNPRCFNPEHLFPGTNLENVQDMMAKGRHHFGSNHYAARLQASDIPTIRRRLAIGDGPTAIARSYGVHVSAIRHIASGKNWKHLPAESEVPACSCVG